MNHLELLTDRPFIIPLPSWQVPACLPVRKSVAFAPLARSCPSHYSQFIAHRPARMSLLVNPLASRPDSMSLPVILFASFSPSTHLQVAARCPARESFAVNPLSNCCVLPSTQITACFPAHRLFFIAPFTSRYTLTRLPVDTVASRFPLTSLQVPTR